MSDRDKLEMAVDNSREEATLQACGLWVRNELTGTRSGYDAGYVCGVQGLSPKERRDLYTRTGVWSVSAGDKLYYAPAGQTVRVCFLVVDEDGAPRSPSDASPLFALPRTGGGCGGADGPMRD